MNKSILIIIILILHITSAFAFEKPLENPSQEKQAQELFNVIRCPVCEGQSLKESPLEIPKIIRNKIRQMIAEGKSEVEIIHLLESRYGTHIISDPHKHSGNYVLKYLPLLACIIGTIFLTKKIRIKN